MGTPEEEEALKRAQAIQPDVPVILISGTVVEEQADVDEGVEEDAIDQDELLRRLQEIKREMFTNE